MELTKFPAGATQMLPSPCATRGQKTAETPETPCSKRVAFAVFHTKPQEPCAPQPLSPCTTRSAKPSEAAHHACSQGSFYSLPPPSSQTQCPTGAIIFAVPHAGHDLAHCPYRGGRPRRAPQLGAIWRIALTGRAAGRAPRAPLFFLCVCRVPHLATAPHSTRTPLQGKARRRFAPLDLAPGLRGGQAIWRVALVAGGGR